MALLASIFEGNEASKIVVIEDNVLHKGRQIIKTSIVSACKRLNAVHLILTENHPESYLNNIPSECRSRLTVHDAVSDPLGLNLSPKISHSSTYLITKLTSAMNLQKHIKSDGMVIIDCLSPLILELGANEVCKQLNLLSKDERTQQVVCLVHSDLHDDLDLQFLRHYASTILSVVPPKIPSYTRARLEHKKVTGKIIKEGFDFTTLGLHLNDIRCVDLEEKSTEPEELQAKPSDDLTFDLTLTEQEKEARAKVDLPFWKHTQPSRPASSQIYYEPDVADDIDDEDPDDDLDF